VTTFVQLMTWPPELVLLVVPLEEPVELEEEEVDELLELLPDPEVLEVLVPLDPEVPEPLVLLDPEVPDPEVFDPDVVDPEDVNNPLLDVPPDAVPPPSRAPQTQGA
jgi:hypothetical protein